MCVCVSVWCVVCVRECVCACVCVRTSASGVLSPPHHSQVEVVQMDTTWVRDNIRVYTDSQVVGNLASLGNFARFYFHKYVRTYVCVCARSSVDSLTVLSVYWGCHCIGSSLV